MKSFISSWLLKEETLVDYLAKCFSIYIYNYIYQTAVVEDSHFDGSRLK